MHDSLLLRCAPAAWKARAFFRPVCRSRSGSLEKFRLTLDEPNALASGHGGYSLDGEPYRPLEEP